MSSEPPKLSDETALLIQQEVGLAKFGDGESSALAEIINRSLVHIHASKDLGMRYRIGDYELCWPDYRLVCTWSEELGRAPEKMLTSLLTDSAGQMIALKNAELLDGKFKSLIIKQKVSPVSGFPPVDGLAIDCLAVIGFDSAFNLDLSIIPQLTCLYWVVNDIAIPNLTSAPNLTKLDCGANQLEELDISTVPNLKELDCCCNRLDRLDLSAVQKLTRLICHDNRLIMLDLANIGNLRVLSCGSNKLTYLDLFAVPNLEILLCGSNNLTKLDTSAVLQLTELDCSKNPLNELDIRPLEYLSKLKFDRDKTRLIQRPEQNFK